MPKYDLAKFIAPHRITSGKGFRLKDHDPNDASRKDLKDKADELLAWGVEQLATLQDKLYAQDRWSVLLVFQAMDAAGKDGVIKHVMSGVNPQGTQVYSFKGPSSEELDHDFLWRTTRALPERGRIGIFNRSYYEEVLVARVHPEILRAQKLPSSLVTKDIWQERYESIVDFEKHLARNGYLILKFFLNVSRQEQRQRFIDRLDLSEKNWKFSANDVAERQYWDAYQEAYEDAIRATAAPHAPWFIMPADRKWYTRLLVAAAIIEAMEQLDLRYPVVDDAAKAKLVEARKLLEAEKD